ncbi:MAG: 2-oxoacid:acceptor oxidoreductase family protein, partial [Deltaproteobacteria bacterium]|nr:2-oxoacid:acceptor oxidoreductase family protein [Deltaproteobacteria bacterium]
AEEMKKKLGFSGKVATVDATRIAWDELGVPIVNTTMLGALLKVVPIVKVASLKTPLEERFGKIAKKNINALNRAYEEVKISKQS